MALLQDITSFLGTILGTIIDDKTNDIKGRELTDAFVKQFGDQVDGVSKLTDKLGLSPVAEEIIKHRVKKRRRGRRQERREEFEGDGFGSFDRLDNFFDFLRGLNEINLDRGRAHGWIFLDRKMLPMLVQQIEVDNVIQDPLDLGVKKPEENLLLPVIVTQQQRLPIGYEPSTIVIKGIIPNGPNTSPEMKLRVLWRFHQSKEDLGKAINQPNSQFSGAFITRSWEIWNPIINSCKIERVKMRRINPATTVDHDAISVNITLREDILGKFFEDIAEEQEPSKLERAIAFKDAVSARIKTIRADDESEKKAVFGNRGNN